MCTITAGGVYIHIDNCTACVCVSCFTSTVYSVWVKLNVCSVYLEVILHWDVCILVCSCVCVGV